MTDRLQQLFDDAAPVLPRHDAAFRLAVMEAVVARRFYVELAFRALIIFALGIAVTASWPALSMVAGSLLRSFAAIGAAASFVVGTLVLTGVVAFAGRWAQARMRQR